MTIATALDIETLRRVYEGGLFALFAVVLVRVLKTRGAEATAREFLFGFVLTQAVELLAVGLDRYRYPDWIAYFPPWPAWVPLGIGVGWATLVPCLMRISETILGREASAIGLGALDGAMAVGLDLILDPAVSGEPLRMWVWAGEGMAPYRLWLLGVPVFNFVGWFLLVGSATAQLRIVERRHRGARRWGALGLFLLGDLAVAGVVMQLPW